MITCPACRGSGMSAGVHGFITCFQCSGTGEVNEEMLEWIKKGLALRVQRADMRLSLFEMAKKLGVTCAKIDSLEKGRVFNLDFNYPEE